MDAERWVNEGGTIAPEAVLRREQRSRLLVVCEAGLAPAVLAPRLREAIRCDWQARGTLDLIREHFAPPVTEVPLP